MTGRWRAVRSWRPAAALACAILAAGCGSVSGRTQAQSPDAATVPLSPTAALTFSGTTWASVPMGAAAGANQFWQLFKDQAGHWSLQTPPDIATNGALLLTTQDRPAPGGTLVVGVHPSLYLHYSPVTTTSDGGHDWATLSPESGLANVPDAIAAAPDGHLVALGSDQTVSTSSSTSAGADWVTLITEHALAATAAGRNCGLTGLTATAYAHTGSPMLGGTCGRAGRVGVFTDSGGTWHLAGPALPYSLTGQRIRVLRLTRNAGSDVVVAEAGTGSAASLFAAWTSDAGRRWSLSPVLRLGTSYPESVSFGDGGATAVVLSGNRGETLAGPGAAWRSLPALPPGRTITLALPSAGTADALASDGSVLTAWQLSPGSARWTKKQVIKVPIQYGSSG